MILQYALSNPINALEAARTVAIVVALVLALLAGLLVMWRPK